MSAGIYRLTNLVTNQIFIGYTSNLKNREADYTRIDLYKGQTLIFNSFKEHGSSNHKFEVLLDLQEIVPTTSELKEIASVYIRYYKYWVEASMLNVNETGVGSGHWTEEKKKEKSRIQKSEGGGFKAKPILQYDTDGFFVKEWESLLSISKTLNLDYNRLVNCCKLRTFSRSVGGFQWRYKNGSIPPSIEKYFDPSKNQRRSILQYDLEGNFIKEWAWINDACAALNIKKSVILNTLKNTMPRYNKQNNEFRFQWKYKTDNYPLKINPYTGIYKIAQYDLSGNLVKVWSSTTEISNALGIKKGRITSCLRNETKKSYKYLWKAFYDVVPNNIEPYFKVPHFEDITLSSNKLLQFDMSGKFLKAWDDISFASNDLNIDRSSIKANISGQLKSAGKYRWQYGTTENVNTLPPLRVICQYDLDGNLIKEWTSRQELLVETGYRNSSISQCLNEKQKQAHGFNWKYKK